MAISPVESDRDLIAALRHNLLHQASHLDRWYSAQAALGSALRQGLFCPIILAAARAVGLDSDDAESFAADLLHRQRCDRIRTRIFRRWRHCLDRARALNQFRLNTGRTQLHRLFRAWLSRNEQRRRVRTRLGRACRVSRSAALRRAFGAVRRHALGGAAFQKNVAFQDWRRSVRLSHRRYERHLERAVRHQRERRRRLQTFSGWRSVVKRKRRYMAGLVRLRHVILSRCRSALRKWLTCSVGCVRRQTQSLYRYRQQICRSSLLLWYQRLVRRRRCLDALRRSLQIGRIASVRVHWQRWRLGGLAYRGAEYLAVKLRRRYRQRWALLAWRELHRIRRYRLRRTMRYGVRINLKTVLTKWHRSSLAERRWEKLIIERDRKRIMRWSIERMKRAVRIGAAIYRLVHIMLVFTKRQTMRLWRRSQQPLKLMEAVLLRWHSIRSNQLVSTRSYFNIWHHYVQNNLARNSKFRTILGRIDRHRARFSGVLLLKRWITYIRRICQRRRHVIIQWRQRIVVSAFHAWSRFIQARRRARHIVYNRLLQVRLDRLKSAWSQLRSSTHVRQATEIAMNFSLSSRLRQRMLQHWVMLRHQRAAYTKRIVTAMARSHMEMLSNAWRQWNVFITINRQVQLHKLQVGVCKLYSVILRRQQRDLRYSWRRWHHHIRCMQICLRLSARCTRMALHWSLQRWCHVIKSEQNAVSSVFRIQRSVQRRLLHFALVRWQAVSPLTVKVALTFCGQRKHYRKQQLLYRWLHVTLRRRRQLELVSRTLTRFLRIQLRYAWHQWRYVTRTSAIDQIYANAVTRWSRYVALGNVIHWWQKYAAHRRRIRYILDRMVNNHKSRCLRAWLSLLHLNLYRSEAHVTHLLDGVAEWKRNRSSVRYTWSRWRHALRKRYRFRHLADHAIRTMVYGKARDCFNMWRSTIRLSNIFEWLRSRWFQSRLQSLFERWKRYARYRRIKNGEVVRRRRRRWLRRWTSIWRQTSEHRLLNKIDQIEYLTLQRRWLLRYWFCWRRIYSCRYKLRRIVKRVLNFQLSKALRTWRQNIRWLISIRIPSPSASEHGRARPVHLSLSPDPHSDVVYANVRTKSRGANVTTIESLFDMFPKTQAACRYRTLIGTFHRWRSFIAVSKQGRSSLVRAQLRLRHRWLRNCLLGWQILCLKKKVSANADDRSGRSNEKKAKAFYLRRISMKSMLYWKRFIRILRYDRVCCQRLRDLIKNRTLRRWRGGLRRRQHQRHLLCRCMAKINMRNVFITLQKWKLICTSERFRDGVVDYRYQCRVLFRSWHCWQRCARRQCLIRRALRRRRTKRLSIALRHWQRFIGDDRRLRLQVRALKRYSSQTRLQRKTAIWWHWRTALWHCYQIRNRRQRLVAVLQTYWLMRKRRWMRRWRRRGRQLVTIRDLIYRACYRYLQRYGLYTIRTWRLLTQHGKKTDINGQIVAIRYEHCLERGIMQRWMGRYSGRVESRRQLDRCSTIWVRSRVRRSWRRWKSYVHDHRHTLDRVIILKRICAQVKSRYAFIEWKIYVTRCRRQHSMLRTVLKIARQSQLCSALARWRRYDRRSYRTQQQQQQDHHLRTVGARSLQIVLRLLLEHCRRRRLLLALHQWALYSAQDRAQRRSHQAALARFMARSELRWCHGWYQRGLRTLRINAYRNRACRRICARRRGLALMQLVRAWRDQAVRVRAQRDGVQRCLRFGRRADLHSAVRHWRSFLSWTKSIQRVWHRLTQMMQSKSMSIVLRSWRHRCCRQRLFQQSIERFNTAQRSHFLRISLRRLHYNVRDQRQAALIKLSVTIAYTHHQGQLLLIRTFSAWRYYQSVRALRRRHQRRLLLDRTVSVKGRVLTTWQQAVHLSRTLQRCSRRITIFDAWRAWREAHAASRLQQQHVRRIVNISQRLLKRHAIRYLSLYCHVSQSHDNLLISIVTGRSHFHCLAIYFHLWSSRVARRHCLREHRERRHQYDISVQSGTFSTWRTYVTRRTHLKRVVLVRLRQMTHTKMWKALQRWRSVPPEQILPPVRPFRLMRLWYRMFGLLVQRCDLLRWACLMQKRRIAAAERRMETLNDEYEALMVVHARCKERDEYRLKVQEQISRLNSERNRLLTRLAVFNEEKQKDLNQAHSQHQHVTDQLHIELNSLRSDYNAALVKIEHVTEMSDHFMCKAAVLKLNLLGMKRTRFILTVWTRKIRARSAFRACLRRHQRCRLYRAFTQWIYYIHDHCSIKEIQSSYQSNDYVKENLTEFELNAEFLSHQLNERSCDLFDQWRPSSSYSPSWPKLSDIMAPVRESETK